MVVDGPKRPERGRVSNPDRRSGIAVLAVTRDGARLGDEEPDLIARDMEEIQVVVVAEVEGEHLLDRALSADPDLASFGGGVADTGEGRWAVEEAVRLAVPVDVIAAALFARFASTRPDSPATRVVSALRGQFGGHTAGPAG